MLKYRDIWSWRLDRTRFSGRGIIKHISEQISFSGSGWKNYTSNGGYVSYVSMLAIAAGLRAGTHRETKTHRPASRTSQFGSGRIKRSGRNPLNVCGSSPAAPSFSAQHKHLRRKWKPLPLSERCPRLLGNRKSSGSRLQLQLFTVRVENCVFKVVFPDPVVFRVKV